MEIIKGFIDGILSNPDAIICIVIFGILIILLDIYYPKFRGFMGEFWVKGELKKLPKDVYITLNDIMIKDEKGTHQIDHIVLSCYGIFVIEMKNYYGLIKGKEYDDKWSQHLGKTKRYFLNPIHQNYGHIKALSTLLNIDEKSFISVICFSNQAKLKLDCKSKITQVDYLRKDILNSKDIILDLDLKNISETIMSFNITDDKQRKQHVKDIHSKVKNNKQLEDNMICPKCGNKLIEKNGKYGKFIGCANFPKCRYIKK